jgi:microcystin-dependent protein
MGGAQAGPAGANQPIDIMNPYLALNFSIAIMGLFPTRN